MDTQRDTLGVFLRNLRERTDRSHVPPRLATNVRRKKGMSRDEVAALAQCSSSYIEKIERGVANNVSVEIVLAVANAVGASDQQVAHALTLAGDESRGLAGAFDTPTITAEQRTYVDSLSPHLAGYVDLAWNILYANDEYCRVFQGIKEYGNVLFWLLECPKAKEIMLDWYEETHLTVTWARSLAALQSTRKEYERVFDRLEHIEEFQKMFYGADPTMGREDPAMLIRDPDDGSKFRLDVNLWSPPPATAGWQMYLGVRVPN